jgi:hypothetical protein
MLKMYANPVLSLIMFTDMLYLKIGDLHLLCTIRSYKACSNRISLSLYMPTFRHLVGSLAWFLNGDVSVAQLI